MDYCTNQPLTLVYTFFQAHTILMSDRGNVTYGYDALTRRGVLRLNYPTESSLVVDWDDEHDIWQYAMTDILGVQPSAHPIVMVMPVLLPFYYDATMSVRCLGGYPFPEVNSK